MMEALRKALADLQSLERRGADLVDADRALSAASRALLQANAVATLELARRIAALTEKPSAPGNTQAPPGKPEESATAAPPEPAGSAGPSE